MASSFEFVQHPRRTLPPPIPTNQGPAAAFLPGTFHPINPKNIAAGQDQVLLSGRGKLVRWLLVIVAIFAITLGINLILDGVSAAGTSTVNRMYQFAEDPLVGLAIGVLATALVQSSSTTTTLAVTAVGSGIISVSVAIPLIIGANIGTSITAMLVAFSYVGERRDFKKAFTSAAMHSWFNIITAIIFFIAEVLFHPLRSMSGYLAAEVANDAPGVLPTSEIITKILHPFIQAIGMNGLIGKIGNHNLAVLICLGLGTLFILVAVRVMSAQIRTITAATATSIIDKLINSSGNSRATARSSFVSFFMGLIFTFMVTASSVTVAFMQPVAVSGTVKRRPVLGVILGANVGTTFTALFATLAIMGSLSEFAMQAAFVHTIMNVVGAAVVLCIPQLSRQLIRLSSATARIASRSYTKTLIIIFGLYIALPALVLAVYALS
ncbi:Na/Pi symporter [Corynebacterium callunae]|uniref:Na/Pi symporter n=1 Tax=Corynebacterium callunae TaxID=1721 RepID=UPI00398214BE